MYDPKVARFLQEDTYTGTADDPLSLNLYTYVKNNPLIYFDPTGHAEAMISLHLYQEYLKSERQKKLEIIYIDPDPFKEHREKTYALLGDLWNRIKQTPDNPKDALLGWYSSGANSGFEILKLLSMMFPVTSPEESYVIWTNLQNDGIESIEEDVKNIEVYEAHKTVADATQMTIDTVDLYNLVKAGVKLPSFISHTHSYVDAGTGAQIPSYLVDYTPSSVPGKVVDYIDNVDNTKVGKTGVGGGNKTPKVSVDYSGKQVEVYRGGTDFEVRYDSSTGKGDIKINKETGNVKTTHGISLDVDPTSPSVASRGANKIESLPEGLKIIQRGKRLEHYEIVPEYEMPLEEFQNLLNQIKTSPVNK